MSESNLGAQKSQKYSIWIPIEAEENSTADLGEIVKELSGEYRTPVFRPHVTVVIDISPFLFLMIYLITVLLFVCTNYCHHSVGRSSTSDPS